MARPSLKTFIPDLAKDVSMTPAALYERQRALVRAGLLELEEGRGPGSGVPTTPASVAMLLTAALATANLSETEDHARVLANLKSAEKRCPLTGKRTFAAALMAILDDESIAKRVLRISVVRGAQGPTEARIYVEEDGSKRSEVHPYFRGKPASQFGETTRVISMLYGGATLILDFAALARSLKEMGK